MLGKVRPWDLPPLEEQHLHDAPRVVNWIGDQVANM